MSMQESKMDTQTIMEAYKKVGTPDAPHKRMVSLTGTDPITTYKLISESHPLYDEMYSRSRDGNLFGIGSFFASSCLS